MNMRALSMLPFALVACTATEPPPTLSLDGPTKIALGQTCLVGDAAPRQRLAPEACEEEGEGPLRTLVERGYLSNQLGDSVAIINMSLDIPELIDTRVDIPGVTHIPVGGRPSDLAVSADGNFVFAFNQVDRDISVISADLRREIERIPVGESIAGFFATKKSSDAEVDALWIVTSESAQVLEVEWSFTCEGGDVYLEGCEPDFSFDVQPLAGLAPGSTPRHAALSATADSLFVTYGDRAHLVEVMLAVGRGGSEDTRACLDAGTVPCVVREIGLTYGCSDGLDNDGDGLVDAADPQCLEPEARESADGVGRARSAACNDGLDNDGDGLIDGADLGCAFSGDGSELGAVKAVACSDGLDNDGDGLTDSDDPECLPGPFHRSEAALPACSDGLDNDDDGLTDSDDPQCTSSLQDDESRRPACSDANDNDNDGLIDEEDPDCASPLGDDESSASSACNDGIDNDQDGAVDLDDPGCSGPGGSTELEVVRACSDGQDNDDDGLLDYPEDPDCFGANGASETKTQGFEYGPIAVDPEGRFAYVVDRRETQVLVLDLDGGTLLDPNACDAQDPSCTPRPFDSAIGVGVGRVPQSITARRLEVSRSSANGEESDRFQVVRERSFAVVASSRGVALFVNGADIIRTLDNGFPTEEVVDPIVRLSDGSPSDAAATTVLCDLDLLRELEEFNAAVKCSDPRLPSIRQVASACDDDCQCEDDGFGQEVCFKNSDAPISMTTRSQTVVDFDDNEEVELRDEDFTDDAFITNETWQVVFEGSIAARTDLVVDAERPGMVSSSSGDFCADDLRPGDILTITASPTPITIGGAEPDCEGFLERDLSYRVASVSANHLSIETIDAELEALLQRPADALPLVQLLPDRSCFGAGAPISIRPVDQWVVTGSRSGRLSNKTSFGGVCVQKYDALSYSSRFNTGETFVNPFFSFRMAPGTEAVPSGHSLTFSTSNRFSALQLQIGSTPTDIKHLDTRRRMVLPVIDAGNNLVRLFDAKNNQLVTVLF
jgi:hypothetical protein